jgi:MFS superfamily sulfate permease-like transporter
MQIPQGMAYALLARLPAIIGKSFCLLNCISGKFDLLQDCTFHFFLRWFIVCLEHRDIYRWVSARFLSYIQYKNYLILGAVAVISLMTGNVVDRLSVTPILSTVVPSLLDNSTIGTISSSALVDASYAITIATTLAFTVGIFQLLLCIFHLGFVTSFFSDSFISGYTTGTAVLVFTSQVPDIFGLTLKRYVGPLNVVYVSMNSFLFLLYNYLLDVY